MPSKPLKKKAKSRDTLTICKKPERLNYVAPLQTLKVKKKRKRRRKLVSAYINANEMYEFEMNRRLEKAIARYQYFVLHKKQLDKKKVNKVQKSLMKSTGPLWYQELSDVQLRAADELYEGLRDDLEQGTVHRSFRLLRLIGIYPIINDKCIRRALELSRGNDLAFLWFLMELYYNPNCPSQKKRKYTVNERIMLSTICHLDMIPTLRELDRILPNAKPKPPQMQTVILPVCTCKYLSPYLEPQIAPIVPHSAPLPPPLIPGPNFGYYNLYKDPNFVQPNEINRWYNNKFEKPVPKTESEIFINDVVCQHIMDVTSENFDRQAVLACLCDNHEKLSEQRSKQIKQLMAVTRCRCNDFNADQNTVLRNQVITQIELDAARTQKDFAELAKGFQTQIIIKTILRNIIENAPDIKNIKPCMNCKDCIEEYDMYQHLYYKNKCGCERKTEKKFLNLGHEGKAKKKYFFKPTQNFPYRFDYEKIFRDAIYKDPVKEGVRLALEVDRYSTEDKAITICMKDLWKLEVKLWNEKMEEMSDDECELSTEEVKPKTKKEMTAKRKTLDVISSRDSRLMKKLLKNGLRQLRQNPKFVLASMPNVYKLKILQEWIRVRYGHVYTPADRLKAMNRSRMQWNILRDNKLVVKQPGQPDIIDSTTVDYDYRDRLGRKVKNKLENYYQNLGFAMINECRIFWPTMAPYLCPSGCPREVFYAYMPSCKYDILPVRPWKLHEVKTPPQSRGSCDRATSK